MMTRLSAARQDSIAAASTLRTAPVYCRSTPSSTPIGWAVMKLPDTVLIAAPAMGELGSPCDSSASSSTRSRPAASFTQVSATASVTRTPAW